ncbi:MAG TPA: outer membrane beta-barrel protein [Gemmatimonadales bacterium]|nr:outer membrane beta-barrel protein [Gemmatimonadales bacterium]
MRSPLLAGLATALLLLPPATASAQRAAEHHGVWVGAGVGLGSAKLSCNVCRPDRTGGTAAYLRAGATITQSVLVGLEATGWYRSKDDIDQLLGSLQAVVLLYPRKASGFYLKTGLGISQFSAKDNQDEVSSQALSMQFGLGYEVAMGRNMSIVPYANFLGSTGADVRFNNTVAGLSANTSLLQFGVGLTLH